ncbi:hypothetical protein AQPE_1687 [Aquipluma nitroreducens]|uniref:Uncharacterized protein n=1 Tax=Aquipluma nitroreducens TaxID=2010828 RepID=A0A5K7S7I5_9BACT|nr:hypothetical protein AQPE_1687 [Aquipluma nitroreducens]
MKEFWHMKKSYHLVGNPGSTYKTCCTAQKQQQQGFKRY